MALFQPKLQHKKWKKRLSAVEKLNNQEILFQLALTDPVPEVATAAMEKISDRVTLTKLSRQVKHDSLQLLLAEKLNDQQLLAQLAGRGDVSGWINDRAFASLTDETLLMELVRQNEYVGIRKKAAKKIRNQDFLMEIINKDMDTTVKKTAANGLMDNGLKASYLALFSTPGSKEREKALAGATNETILRQIGIEDEDMKIRRAVIANLQNEEIIWEIASRSYHAGILEPAARKINDQVHLLLLAKKEARESESAAQVAVQKIKDDALLYEVAEKGYHPRARIAAIEKIKEQALLLRLAHALKKEEYEDPTVVLALARRVTDNDALRTIFHAWQKPAYYSARITAIEGIQKEEMLYDLLLEESDGVLQEAIVAAMKRKDILLKATEAYHNIGAVYAMKKLALEHALIATEQEALGKDFGHAITIPTHRELHAMLFVETADLLERNMPFAGVSMTRQEYDAYDEYGGYTYTTYEVFYQGESLLSM